MRTNLNLRFLLPAVLTASALAQGSEKQGEIIKLFDPSEPAAWTAFRGDGQSDTHAIWEMRDGLLVLKAGPLGYLRTERDFTDFALELEWRRPPDKKPGRGGVLIRMTGPDKIWPKSLEAQLNAGAAGDFWGLGGYRLTGPSERLQQVKNEQLGLLTNLRKTEDAETATGQWNRYEIRAHGQTVTLKINGRVVNEASGCDVVAGKICLTAEGDEIHFRNVRVKTND